MELLASAARDAGSNVELRGVFGAFQAAKFQLTVSAAAIDAGDTLDVYIQHSVDGGVTWDDFVHFTQVLGNGGAKKFLATWSELPTPESEITVPTDGTMAAGVKQGPVGSKWRVKWIIVDVGGDDALFTFKVDAEGVRRSR